MSAGVQWVTGAITTRWDNHDPCTKTEWSSGGLEQRWAFGVVYTRWVSGFE